VTPAVASFVEEVVKRNGLLIGKTLDIGSMDINGCVRHLFTNYTGLDMRAGANVDIVLDAHILDSLYEPGTFDNVLSLEMLEHDSAFWQTIYQMKKVLKTNGWLIITTRGFHFPRHDHPSDYWRFSADALNLLLKDDMHTVYTREDIADMGVFAYARKR